MIWIVFHILGYVGDAFVRHLKERTGESRGGCCPD